MTLRSSSLRIFLPFLFSIFLRTKNKMFNNSQRDRKNNMPWVKVEW